MKLHVFEFSKESTLLSVRSPCKASTESDVLDIPLTYDNFKKELLKLLSTTFPNIDINPECLYIYAQRGTDIVRVITPNVDDILFCIIENPSPNTDSFPLFLRTPANWVVAWGSPYVCLLVDNSVLVKDVLETSERILGKSKLGVAHTSSERCLSGEVSLDRCSISKPTLLDCDVSVQITLKIITGDKCGKMNKLSIGPIRLGHSKTMKSVKMLLNSEYNLKSNKDPLIFHKEKHITDSTTVATLFATTKHLPGGAPLEISVLLPPKQRDPLALKSKQTVGDCAREMVNFVFVDPLTCFVSNLKKIVEEEFGILDCDQRLNINSIPLNDNKLLSEYLNPSKVLTTVLVEKASPVKVVVTSQGKTYDFLLNSFTTIYKLKTHIGRALRVPIARQILKINNEELLDSQILSNYSSIGRAVAISVKLDVNQNRRVFKIKCPKQPFFQIPIMDINNTNVAYLKQEVSKKKGCDPCQLSMICLISGRLLDDNDTPLAEYSTRGYNALYIIVKPPLTDVKTTFHVELNGDIHGIESTVVNGKTFHASAEWAITADETHSLGINTSTTQETNVTVSLNDLKSLGEESNCYDGDNDSDVLQSESPRRVKERKKPRERSKTLAEQSPSDSGFTTDQGSAPHSYLSSKGMRRQCSSHPDLMTEKASSFDSLGNSMVIISKESCASQTENDEEFEIIDEKGLARDKDVIDDITLHNISLRLGTSWKKAVRCLGIREDDITIITEENMRDVYEQSVQALILWKKQTGYDATRSKLRHVLIEILRKELADQYLPPMKDEDEIAVKETPDGWVEVLPRDENEDTNNGIHDTDSEKLKVTSNGQANPHKYFNIILAVTICTAVVLAFILSIIY